MQNPLSVARIGGYMSRMWTHLKKYSWLPPALVAMIALMVSFTNIVPVNVTWLFQTRAAAETAQKEALAETKAVSDRVDVIEKKLMAIEARNAEVYDWTREITAWVRDQRDKERRSP